jgi:hypothetical protein
MRIICLHKDGLDHLLRLGAAINDLTPSGIGATPYHLVAASPEQLEALQGLAVQHEDVTPEVLRSTKPSEESAGFLYCRGGTIPNGTRLRTSYKSKQVEAEVRGCAIWLNGRAYDNPSLAARGAGHGSVNGWKVWEYLDRKDGKWRPLHKLRARGAA